MQSNAPADLPAPSEDCLYLNLYRPAGTREGRRLPVLVYVHGGGFNGGTASARDGAPLASSNDLIVVTINYRLGVFGWLSLAGLDAEAANRFASGNYGLLDMAAALRWLQENVEAFGGDRTNVTLSGTSAGGIGVCALMATPLREQLFHRAILQSAECTYSSGYITSHHAALRQGAMVAANAGCADSAAFVACLRAKPAADVLKASIGLGSYKASVGGHLMARAPMDVIQSGDLRRIPVIVGATHDEQRRSPLATTGFPGTQEGYQKYLADTFGTLAPLVASHYPPGAFKDPAYAAGAAASDSGVPNGIGVCPMLVELGSALAKVTTTFAYELNDPQASANSRDEPGFQPGSQHTAEIPFLFAQPAPETRSAAQMELANRMRRYWATFATNGRPHDGAHEWPPMRAPSHNVLRLQPSGDSVVDLPTLEVDHRCAFWAQVGY
jgi:para-nitrobenzyl esterase